MFARSEHDRADVAVDTGGFVLRARCFCELVQFLLDVVRPNGVQHLHDPITRVANYERRLRLKYASTEAARLAPDSIPEQRRARQHARDHKGAVITSDTCYYVGGPSRGEMIGVGKAFGILPSEPYRRFSRIRLSSRWFPDHRGCLACRQAVSRVKQPGGREEFVWPAYPVIPAVAATGVVSLACAASPEARPDDN
jgi:hypothetical protein